MKKISILLAFDFIISLLYYIIRHFDKFSFINCFFIIGMTYFLFGSLCFVFEKGFFNITLFSFNKLNHQIQKKMGVLSDEDDITLDEYLSRSYHFNFTKNLLISGGLISLTSILIGFMLL